jgi:DNA-directed RNA polymerase specialized sigma24 family protein
MDQPIYLLLGAGVLILAVALFMKKENGDRGNLQRAMMHQPMERAEMEKALQRFVKQVKEENEKLADEMRLSKQSLEQQIARLEERVQAAEQRLAGLGENSPTSRGNTGEAPAVEEEEDLLALHERYRRVFELKQEGLDIEEIAKRLGAGRGEIELILSLASPHERGSTHG